MVSASARSSDPDPDRTLLFVIDADCLVAGTIARRGVAFELLDLWRDGAFELIACPHLVEEVKKALLQPRVVSKYSITRDEVSELARELSNETIWLDDPRDPPRAVAADPGDDYLVAIALAAGADALVTRDHHFDGVVMAGLNIIGPREALRRLGFDALSR